MKLLIRGKDSQSDLKQKQQAERQADVAQLLERILLPVGGFLPQANARKD